MLRINPASSVNHRPHFTNKLRNLFNLHPRFPGNPVKRAFIIRHLFNVYLNLPSQLFGKISKLLPHQVVMVLLLKIQCTYQFSKFERSICRFTYDGDNPLPPLCRKYHKEKNGNHSQIQSPAKRWLRKEIAERGLLHLYRFFHISFRAKNRKISHVRQQTEEIGSISSIQHPIVCKK